VECKNKSDISVLGVNGTTSISLRKYLSNIWESKKSRNYKKIAILGNAHLLRKVLTYGHKTFDMGNNVACTVNCKYI